MNNTQPNLQFSQIMHSQSNNYTNVNISPLLFSGNHLYKYKLRMEAIEAIQTLSSSENSESDGEDKKLEI